MAKFNYSGRFWSVEFVRLSEVRPHLTELLSIIHDHGVKLRLMRHGKPVAALISNEDFQELLDAGTLARFGPIHPVTGKDMGPYWVKETGWKPGMAFQWTKTSAVVSDTPIDAAVADLVMDAVSMAAPEDTPAPQDAPTPEPKKKRWFLGKG